MCHVARIQLPRASFLEPVSEIRTDRSRQFQIRSLRARSGFLILGAGVIETDGYIVRQRIELNRARPPGVIRGSISRAARSRGELEGGKEGRELSSYRLTGAFVERFATG